MPGWLNVADSQPAVWQAFLLNSDCSADCACTHHAGVLAVDTSHICFLGRVAAADDHEPEAFVELMAIQRCKESRSLVTSTELLAEELNLADAGCPVRKYLPSAPLTSLASVSGHAAPTHDVLRLQGLPVTSPDGDTVLLHDRDATLVVAADVAAAAGDDDVVLVSDDEGLLYWQHEMLMRGEVTAMPLHVLQLFSRMVTCQAIDAETFLRAAEVEELHYDELGAAAEWKMITKLSRLERLTNAVAAATSNGST